MINEIIDRAMELEGVARQAYLDEACGDNETLRESVERVLAVLTKSVPADFLKDPIPMPDLPDLPGFLPPSGALQPGDRIDVYRIVERIGHGGMGEVYLAERDDGAFEQKVAIKMIRAGMGTGEVLRRFHYERQILANLEHPNIARLLHGGLTEGGHPYFVMEYVEGEPIDVYCDRNELSVRARLELFRTVCDAVRYAQRNLVVHRDLKPGNILVTEEGVVKLLDFGIAKLLEPDSDPITAFQTSGQLGPFTPAYAAPEQVVGRPINAATDVYALGVILYELLTGRRPYELERGGGLLPENVRLICEKVPSLPSSVATRRFLNEETRLQGKLSALRGADPDRLRKTLQGDLDAIVMKALKKEPERRYASAGELLADLDNFLAHRPVSAQRDSVRYRAYKFVQRHRVPVFAGFVAVTALVVGLVTALVWADVAEYEQAQRKIEAESANEALNYIVELFNTVDPDNAQGRGYTSAEIIENALGGLNELQNKPLARARIINTIATVRLNWSHYGIADSLFQVSIDILSDAEGEKTRTLVDALYGLSQVKANILDFEHAIEYSHQARSILEEASGEDKIMKLGVQNLMAYIYRIKGDYEKCRENYEESIKLANVLRVEFGDNTSLMQLISETFHGYGSFNYRTNNNEVAQKYLEEALDLRIKYLGSAHPKTGTTYQVMGNLYRAMAVFPLAEEYYQAAIHIFESAYTRSHRATGSAIYELGRMYEEMGSYNKALVAYQSASDILSDNLPKEDYQRGIPLLSIIKLAYKMKNYDLADRAGENLLSIVSEFNLMENNKKVFVLRNDLSEYLLNRGKKAQARALLAESREYLLQRSETFELSRIEDLIQQ